MLTKVLTNIITCNKVNSWVYFIMQKVYINPAAKARHALNLYKQYEPLSSGEAAIISHALRKTAREAGIPDLESRLHAGFARLLLSLVTQCDMIQKA